MSIGFEGRGLKRKRLDTKGYTNIFEPIVGHGDAAVDGPAEPTCRGD
jgi:hypothetical protein